MSKVPCGLSHTKARKGNYAGVATFVDLYSSYILTRM